MSATTVDLTAFNTGMARFVRTLGIEAPRVVKKEAGELLKELVMTTPIADSKKVESGVMGKFNSISDSQNSSSAGINGKPSKGGGVVWYAVGSRFLMGVAPEKDMRGATVQGLSSVLNRITKGGKSLSYSFKNRNSRQRVLISQTILTKQSTLRKLVAQIRSHRGRLKAGWLGSPGQSWDILQPSGANLPGEVVMRHKAVARGYAQDELNVVNHPAFSIANTARGVGNKKNNLNWIVKRALETRAIKMAANALLFMRGKKHVSDY